MKKICNIFLFCCITLAAVAQNDSVIERSVTVEREFQPVITPAGKIEVQPQIHDAEITPATVTYSAYSNPLKTDFNINPLNYAEVNFTQPRPLNGFLRGAVGHTASRFDFNYRVSEKKNVQLDIHANHLGQWGRKTMSDSRLGFDFSKQFSKADLYFGVEGRNTFFTRYGRYFQYTDSAKMTGDFVGLDKYSQFADEDKGNHWEVNTKIGVRSLPNQDVQYKVQTGYEAFIMTKDIAEHTINTQAMLDWHSDAHHVGADLAVQNHIYSADLSGYAWSERNKERGDTVINNYHAIKFEPYYAYAGKRFNLHAGVNVDFCIGKGKLILPSPNVTFEAKLTEKWLALYGGAVGDYRTESVRDHFNILRYLHPENEVATTQNRTYVPVDAFLGFKMRPQANLLIDIYAHYILTKYQVYFMPDANGYFNLMGGDNYRWKVGGKVNYHYKDIVNISLNGYYAIGTMLTDSTNMALLNLVAQLPDGHILDTPTWGLNFRVDAKINSKISLYSDNYFGGGKYMLGFANTAGELQAVQAKPVIDLNLGAQYNINKWLSCYLQLNNYINRKHDCFYGYQSQGINFLAGVTWSF